MKPSIGRIVHMMIPASAAGGFVIRPAIIVAVSEDLTRVDVELFGAYWLEDQYPIGCAEGDGVYQWRWPPREK